MEKLFGRSESVPKKMSKVFPLLKYALVAFVLIFFIGGVFLFTKKSLIQETKNTQPLTLIDLSSVFKETYSFTTDSDADGLSDAKEIIYGSDPKNPDTDRDGFTDSKEVRAGFDPLIPGENKGRLEERQNPSLSIQYFTWVQAKRGDQDPHLESKLIEEFLREKGQLKFLPPFVGEEDISFTNDDPKKITNYLSFTGKLALPEKGAPFLALAKEVVRNQALETLQEILDSIGATLQDLQKSQVPGSLQELHRGYVGVWLSLQDIFESLKKAQRDPVAVFFAQKRGEWLVGEIARIEEKRREFVSSLRLQLLKETK